MNAPGVTTEVDVKVMLAGEYAILVPGGEALAVASAPGFEVSLEPAPQWRVELPDIGHRWHGDSLALPRSEAGAAGPAVEALRAARATWAELPVVRVRFRSRPGRLDVGASAALVVGTLKAAAQLLGVEFSPQALLPRAVAAHRRAQGSGSGYDVATLLLGGTVLCRGLPEGGLDARRVTYTAGRIVVASLPTRAATGPQVATVMARCGGSAELARHVAAGNRLVAALTSGAGPGDVAQAVLQANLSLAALDRLAEGTILTPEIEAALAAGAPFPVRVSGAGGGDLVVGFAADAQDAGRLLAQWRAAGLSAREL